MLEELAGTGLSRAVALCLAASRAAEAQQRGTSPALSLTLDQAVQYAVDHYPAVRAALEQVNASSADVDVARGAYFPRLDAVWQSSRATGNNVFGQVLP
jgi:outer membrane protein TolC